MRRALALGLVWSSPVRVATVPFTAGSCRYFWPVSSARPLLFFFPSADNVLQHLPPEGRIDLVELFPDRSGLEILVAEIPFNVPSNGLDRPVIVASPPDLFFA